MQRKNIPTSNISKEIIFKSLVKFDKRFSNRVYLSNKVSPDDEGFYTKISRIGH